MKNYETDKIRNVSLLGHSSSGKTTVTEALLYATGVTNRQGRVDDGNTFSDFEKEEISRKVSIGLSVIPIENDGYKFNFLDTPGYFDFIGEMYGAKRASEGSLLIIDAQAGVEVGTEKAWKNLEKYLTPRIIFLNKMDKENVNFDRVYASLRAKLSDKIIPFALPIGEGETYKGLYDIIDQVSYEYVDGKYKKIDTQPEYIEKGAKYLEQINELVAESDEELMEKYFSGEKFTREELDRGLKKAVKRGELAPLIPGSAEKTIGMDAILTLVQKYISSPSESKPSKGISNGEIAERRMVSAEPFSAVVFKTIVDPFVGKLSLFKVISGKLTKNTDLYNSTQNQSEKLGGIFYLRGKNQIETDEVVAGDIAATSKLYYTKTGDTLCTKENQIVYETIRYPQPTLFMAVESLNQKEDDKGGISLNKLLAGDPTFTIERNSETKELLIGGQGNMQLMVISEKLKNSFGVEINLKDPKIAYRETIKGVSSVQGKHKKQSGGAGQYGDVFVRFEPSVNEFEFAQEVFGGSVPRNFFPAVEKGIRDSLENGILAGYPVVNIKATLFDGSYHDVDSNEMAFKIAAQIAFKKGMEEAKPVLLEPIVKVEIIVPEEYMGDVMGDMNKRRGRILGMEQQADGTQKITAEAPHGEMFQYPIDLRAITQARGNFEMEFVRYEEVPAMFAEKIIAAANAEK